MQPVPSADELAAIAAAYLRTMQRAGEPDPVAATSRWRLAARLPVEPERARFGTALSRWKAAGRLDG